MKKINLLILILSSYLIFSQKNLTETDFKKFCDSNGLKFEMPTNYKSIPVKKNRDLFYSFAIINSKSSMEIRYTIWPLKPIIEKYNKTINDKNSIMVSPNSIYKGRVQANVLNMTGGKMYNITRFLPQAVKKEFKADDGGTCILEFNCEFGKGYKYGQFIYLHKDNVADVIITFMSNDLKTHSDLMLKGFYSLTFK